MSISTTTYRTRTRVSEGREQRRWVEICECATSGGVRRIIARTPAIIGAGDDAERRLSEAEREAERMLSAFLGSEPA